MVPWSRLSFLPRPAKHLEVHLPMGGAEPLRRRRKRPGAPGSGPAETGKESWCWRNRRVGLCPKEEKAGIRNCFSATPFPETCA